MNYYGRKFSFRCGQCSDGTVIGLIGLWRWEWIIANTCAYASACTSACTSAYAYANPGACTCANATARHLHHWWERFGSGHRSLGGVAQ